MYRSASARCRAVPLSVWRSSWEVCPGRANAQDFSEFSRARDAALARNAVSARAQRTPAVTARVLAPRTIQSAGTFPPDRARPRRVRHGSTLAGRPGGPGRFARAAASLRLQPGQARRDDDGLDRQGQRPHAIRRVRGDREVGEALLEHLSRRPMPFMQRLTMSGVALHSGHVTGRRPRMAACGCRTSTPNACSA